MTLMAKAANGTLPSMPEKQPRFMDRFSKATKVGFVLLGYFLGIIGVLIDWAIGHKKKMMECSAEAIWYGLIGWGASMITRFALLALGINKTDYLLQLFGPGVTVWNILWCICGACFIVLSMLWIYGLRTKMTDAERAYNLKGDDHFRNGEKTLRYDGGITVNALPEEIWPYMQQAGQSKGGWYSFERLERLFTFDIRNHYDWKKYPQWQNLHVGEFQWFHQAPLSIGEWVTDCSNGENGLYYWAAHSDTATDPTWKTAAQIRKARFACGSTALRGRETGKCTRSMKPNRASSIVAIVISILSCALPSTSTSLFSSWEPHPLSWGVAVWKQSPA